MCQKSGVSGTGPSDSWAMIQHPSGPVRWLTGRHVASILDSSPQAASPIPSDSIAKAIPISRPTVCRDLVIIPPERTMSLFVRHLLEIASRARAVDQVDLKPECT